MTQLSRPFQIALVAMGLLVAVWFVAQRGHSSGAGSAASAPATATSTPAATPSPGAPSTVYHGSAPGIEALTRDIAKAHGAVRASEQNAKQLEQKSAQASSPTSQGSAAAAAGASTPSAKSTTSTAAQGSATHPAATTQASAPASKHSATKSTPAEASKTASKGAKPSTASANAAPAMQVEVEKQLKQDGTVIVLFWSPTGAVDAYVHNQLAFLQAYHRVAGLPQNRHIALDVALASQVASFGSITRSAPISGTPTILIITGNGRTKTLSGFSDAYSIQQAIGEARQ